MWSIFVDEYGGGKEEVFLGEDASWVVVCRRIADSKKSSDSFTTYVGGYSDLSRKIPRLKS